MKHSILIAAAVSAATAPISASAQPASAAAPTSISLPVNTLVEVTPAQDITSKQMKEGTTRQFLTIKDIDYKGVTFIPRGSPVTAEVTWRTGKGIVGKSAKFELTFRSVRVNGREELLRGTHRQEGRGNTVGALLGSMWISGRSATMVPGQVVNVFTAEPITMSVVAVSAEQAAAAAPPVIYAPAARTAPAPAISRQYIAPGVRCITC